MAVQGGLLVGKTVGRDPIVQVSGLQVDAGTIRCLKIRLRSDTSDRAQVFWATTDSQISESNSLRFEVTGDGQFHDYVIDLGQSPQWHGLVTALRFDVANQPGVKFGDRRDRFFGNPVDWVDLLSGVVENARVPRLVRKRPSSLLPTN